MIGRDFGVYNANPTTGLLPLSPYTFELVFDAVPGASGGGVLQNIFWTSHSDPTLYWVGIFNLISGYYPNNIRNSGVRDNWFLYYTLADCASEWGSASGCQPWQ